MEARLTQDHLPHRVQITVSWTDQQVINLWCLNNIGRGGRIWRHPAARWVAHSVGYKPGGLDIMCYSFASKDDAALFELTWC